MMYPIMVKIDFAEVLKAGRTIRPVALTLIMNWVVAPFAMLAIATFFLGMVFLPFIGPEAVDYVKVPMGLKLDVGAHYGSGTVVLHDGLKMLEVPLWRSNVAGCILLGSAGDGGDQLTDDVGTLWSDQRVPAGSWAIAGAMANAFTFCHRLRRIPASCWICLAKVDSRGQGRNLVPGEIPACTDASDDYLASCHVDSALLVQGRSDP
jgi:hypothetical protein